MKKQYVVEYQNGKKFRLSKVLPGPLLLTTKALKVHREKDDCAIITPIPLREKEDEESELPDILVGSIPLIYLSDDGKTPVLDYLKLPPPPPFQEGDIEEMWNTLRFSKCIIPNTVLLQGQYAPGSAGDTTGKQIVSEYLYYAHQQCRYLLSRWPLVEGYEIVRRNIELGGGREASALTERRLGTLPLLKTKEGRRIPLQTFRRRSSDLAWKSLTLRQAASNLIEDIKAQFPQLSLNQEGHEFIAPFADVADLATPRQAQIDPPVSTWPFDAKQCYESLLAARAVLEAKDQGAVPTPLSLLWRLYEVWIAALCFQSVCSYLGFCPIGASTKVEGCEWMANWKLDYGITVTLFAQPTISKEDLEGASKDSFPLCFIKSVSSDLRPDVLLAISSKESWHLLLVDAKKRSPTTKMDANEVAEAGSKYAWGIRYKGGSSGFPVSSVIVASTMEPAAMHSSESRISSISVLPRNRQTIEDVMGRELNRLINELLLQA